AVRELKENYGLHALRKHSFMANWAWLLIICLAHNLCCWTQVFGLLGRGADEAGLRAKRLRYRYLTIPALVVRSARRVIIKLSERYPFRVRFLAVLDRLRAIPPPVA